MRMFIHTSTNLWRTLAFKKCRRYRINYYLALHKFKTMGKLKIQRAHAVHGETDSGLIRS